jgi:hypothetical protein
MGTIYLLRTNEYLKLGWSGQQPWDRRLHQIRNASPYDVEVLAARPGTLEQEQELHAGAADWKHKGDWYNDCQAFREYVDRFFYPDSGDPILVPAEGCTDSPPGVCQ